MCTEFYYKAKNTIVQYRYYYIIGRIEKDLMKLNFDKYQTIIKVI